MNTNIYRIVRGIGPYWDSRWELQKQYFYYDGDKKVTSWSLEMWSSRKELVIEALNKRLSEGNAIAIK